MKKYIFLPFAACFLLATQLFAGALPYPFKLLPQPTSITLSGQGGFTLASLRQITLKGGGNLPVLGTLLLPLPVVEYSAPAGKGTVILSVDSTLSAIPSAEGYILTVTSNNITITAKGQAGLFYGCQSLEQLLEDARDFNKPVPACTITDYPALSYRAVHFDVKHHLDHMNYYYESIDRLARYKINAVVFEFEDKLRYQLQPLVGAPQSISIDEMAALTLYARQRNIEITPLVQGLGHATFILKHEEYANLRELPYSHWAFCPLNEGTYQVLFDLYRDAIKATPGSKYLHIGGDEIGNIGLCPRCKPTADKQGLMALNLYWLKRICAFARENNRIPIFWDDMPLQYAGLYESTWSDDVTAAAATQAWQKGVATLDSLQTDFPNNCVYMRWNYGMARQPGNIMALNWYQKHGLNAMVATATNGEGGMLFQQDERDKGPASTGIVCIKSFVELAAEKNISGMLCTAWDDKSPHMENYWRGFIAAAEYSWHPNGRTLDEFDAAWLQREFGLQLPDYKSFAAQLRKGSELWYGALYKKGNFFDDDNTLLSLKRVEHWLKPLAGQEFVQFDYTTKLIGLPNLTAPGTWSAQYKDKLAESAAEVAACNATVARLQQLYNSAARNRYFWGLQLAMYQFQTCTPRLLLALQQTDSPGKAQQQAGLQQVRQALATYDQAWANLQAVYSITRHINYPAGYLPDRYFHTASQREDLTWMTQAQDLYHGMVREWMK
jgi:hexosaminidase